MTWSASTARSGPQVFNLDVIQVRDYSGTGFGWHWSERDAAPDSVTFAKLLADWPLCTTTKRGQEKT
ncbi:MAG: hypothetical protein QOI28_4273 [Mycobacterium sp.]|nr:hypothetical protein [Mycobacterium sp.]